MYCQLIYDGEPGDKPDDVSTRLKSFSDKNGLRCYRYIVYYDDDEWQERRGPNKLLRVDSQSQLILLIAALLSRATELYISVSIHLCASERDTKYLSLFYNNST